MLQRSLEPNRYVEGRQTLQYKMALKVAVYILTVTGLVAAGHLRRKRFFDSVSASIQADGVDVGNFGESLHNLGSSLEDGNFGNMASDIGGLSSSANGILGGLTSSESPFLGSL